MIYKSYEFSFIFIVLCYYSFNTSNIMVLALKKINFLLLFKFKFYINHFTSFINSTKSSPKIKYSQRLLLNFKLMAYPRRKNPLLKSYLPIKKQKKNLLKFRKTPLNLRLSPIQEKSDPLL